MKQKKPAKNHYRKLRENCIMPKLFRGWTPEKTLKVIKNTITSDPQWMRDNVLKKDFPKKSAEQKHAAGKWSYGYCYYIAEVTTLIFDAIPLSYQRLFKKNKKGGGKYGTHWVLKISDFCFDPEKDRPMPATRYLNYGGRSFTPQHPSKSAIKLFDRIRQHCERLDGSNPQQQKWSNTSAHTLNKSDGQKLN